MATVCSAPGCGKPLPPAKGTRPRLYCDSSCRGKAYAARKAGVAGPLAVAAPDPGPGGVETATLLQLQAIDREMTPLGQAAVTIARRVDRGGEAGPGLASLVKQLEATLRSVAVDAKQAERTPLDHAKDELAKRRSQRGA